MHRQLTALVLAAFVAVILVVEAHSQTVTQEFDPAVGQVVEVINKFGRVEISAGSGEGTKARISASGDNSIGESDLRIENTGLAMRITVRPRAAKRIDLSLRLPERSRVRATTSEGEISVSGNFESIEAHTQTGTIMVDIPPDDVRYQMTWTASRPRIVADFPIEPARERKAGRFEVIGGRRELPAIAANGTRTPEENAAVRDTTPNGFGEPIVLRSVSLLFTTERGIVLINVPPNEVTGDLRERPLTEAAKAIIRSGDRVMMDAIRRAAPKFFGDYERTLPPFESRPELTRAVFSNEAAGATIKRATVTVTDHQNRAIAGLGPSDFELTENSEQREIISVRRVEAPVNLVLLLDVSGSIENYVTFIRKAARSFVETVDKDDRISIVIFSEDVKVLAGFSTDRRSLSESLDSFDAGGATAYYDALGFVISESLRPLKGERTAIVVLTDGDDNRSFLAFDSLIGGVEESGALIYPLYVPSSLIAASAASGFRDIDPLRNRHLTLTSKADSEGRRLASVSGGQYYPISQLSQINAAYEDIVLQLRTAYDITFRSRLAEAIGNNASPRLRVKVNRPNLFVQVGPVVPVN